MVKVANKKSNRSVSRKRMGDIHEDVADYINKKSPEWNKRIAEMEKKAALRKSQEPVKEEKVEGDLLYATLTKHKIPIKKIVILGYLVIGCLLVIMVSSCFGGNNVEIAPPSMLVTTTTLQQSSDISANLNLGLIAGIVFALFVVPAFVNFGRHRF